MAGGLSGAVGGIAGNPADVVNVRMQNDGKLPLEKQRKYRHALDGMTRIVREEGLSALYRGVSANVNQMFFINIDWSCDAHDGVSAWQL